MGGKITEKHVSPVLKGGWFSGKRENREAPIIIYLCFLLVWLVLLLCDLCNFVLSDKPFLKIKYSTICT